MSKNKTSVPTEQIPPLMDEILGEFDDLVPVLVDIPWGGEGEYVEPKPFNSKEQR